MISGLELSYLVVIIMVMAMAVKFSESVNVLTKIDVQVFVLLHYFTVYLALFSAFKLLDHVYLSQESPTRH